MDMKTYVWGGFFAGAGLGSMVPLLWGEGALTTTSLSLVVIGGALGIGVGYALGKSFDAQ